MLLIVFAVFIVATVGDADFGQLAVSTYPSVKEIAAAVALTFFAYLGFAVIATTAEAILEPGRNVPLATYVASGHRHRAVRADLDRVSTGRCPSTR